MPFPDEEREPAALYTKVLVLGWPTRCGEVLQAFDDGLRPQLSDPCPDRALAPCRGNISSFIPPQEKIADEVTAELNDAGLWDDPIVTKVVPLEAFYPAEEYHQEYFFRGVCAQCR